MKKGFKIVGIIVLVFIIGVLVWCLVPTRFCNIDAQQVEKIEVFDGAEVWNWRFRILRKSLIWLIIGIRRQQVNGSYRCQPEVSSFT